MPDPIWRLSVPPLAGLEGQGRGTVGGGGAAGGLSHPFPQPTSAVCGAHPYAFVQPLAHQGGCAQGGYPGFNYQGCGGACSASLPVFTAVCLWSGKPRSRGVRSSTSRPSIASWMCHTSRWRPSSLSLIKGDLNLSYPR